MFDWFRRKDPPPQQFPDNNAAFAHACSMGYRLLLNALVPGLVVGEGRRGSEGEHCFRLRLAGPPGTPDIWGSTLADAPGYPQVGDLVAFRIVRIATELPEDASLIGYIAGKLEPVLEGKRGWRIVASYIPPHMKPELHL